MEKILKNVCKCIASLINATTFGDKLVTAPILLVFNSAGAAF